MPNENLTFINIILDKSGSMESVRDDTIGGFNAFLAAQKDLPGDAILSLVQFSDTRPMVPTHDAEPLDLVSPLTRQSYVPGGGTALYDAIGSAVLGARARVESMAEEKRPAKTLFVILTDGQENSSTEFSKVKIRDLVTEQRAKYASEFVFIGAGLDAMEEGTSLGVSASNAVQYEATPAGTRALMHEVSSGVGSYRGSAVADMDDVLGRGSK